MKIIDIRNKEVSVNSKEALQKASFNEKMLYDMLNKRNHNKQANVIETVQRLIADIEENGDTALLKYTLKFDNVALTCDTMRVSKEEIEAAYSEIDPELLSVIKKAAENIRAFHSKQKQQTWLDTESEGVILGQKITPLEMVGIYVPGGTAPLPSSVLMNAIPAKVAGVGRIIMCTPPSQKGKINSAILVAANEAGVSSIYKAGGAQAIAAMAIGTETIPKVDKVTGPGNIYVATAKKLVYGYCDIDMIAGPSEVMVIADKSANARYVAADLLSQAEHDILASSILVTTEEALAYEVETQVCEQLKELPRAEISEKSIADFGAIVIVNEIKDAINIANKVAPEHLELCVENPFDIMTSVKNAGAIFLGNYSPEPLGDYFAGPNHVLPTSGSARFFSPLSTADFTKCSSIVYYTREALKEVNADIIRFAEAETLDAHANSIRVRFEDREEDKNE